MLIECDSCAGRGRRCPSCVVTALGCGPDEASTAPQPIRFDRAERHAIDVLAWAGLLPAIPGRPDADSREQAAACLVLHEEGCATAGRMEGSDARRIRRAG